MQWAQTQCLGCRSVDVVAAHHGHGAEVRERAREHSLLRRVEGTGQRAEGLEGRAVLVTAPPGQRRTLLVVRLRLRLRLGSGGSGSDSDSNSG